MSGPRVVAIGGGHGAAQTLRAARQYAGAITAVISVADDGGSSGRLREQLGIPAPGDLRRCIGALVPDRSPLADALEYRFDGGDLEGHAFGNLLIAALAATCGDFAAGVAEAARLCGATGTVLPAAAEPVVLKGLGRSGELVGQAEIKRRGGIERVELVPPDPAPAAGAAEAILAADQVVIGPGSLFTSLLAATAVPAVHAALRGTAGQRVYVANLREQPPETAGFDVADHLAALAAHGVVVDVVVAERGGLPLGELPAGLEVVVEELSRDGLVSHDPALLGAVLERLLLARASGAAGE